MPINKEIKQISKNGQEIANTINNKMKFMDSARFIPNSVLSLDDSLAAELHKYKCKGCKCYLFYSKVKERVLQLNCLNCNKSFEEDFDKDLKK